MTKQVVQLSKVVIRFAGDSGDGMQLTGDRFTSETAGLGNDLSTLPDFPAEIRAPAGTLPGVSAFQLREVKLGIEYEGNRVVQEGLLSTDAIVVDGAFHLNNERKRRALQ